MRQINIILSGLLALSLGFAGCSSEEPLGSTNTTLGTGTPVAFSAAFSSEYDGSIKKLAYGSLSGMQTSMNWTANDHIRIWSSLESGSSAQGVYMTATGGDPAEFAHVSQEGSTEITWASDISSAQPQKFQAFFPGNAETTGFTADGKARFTVPATQHLTAANGYGMDNVLLYDATTAESKSDNIAFEFENVVTVLKLIVPLSKDENENDIVIGKVEVRARGANAGKLAGMFTAKAANTNPATDFSDATFDVDNESSLVTVYPPADEGDWASGTLYIALAPYDYDGLTVTIVGADGTNRIAQIVSQRGANIVKSHRLYPINQTSLTWIEHVVNMGILVESSTETIDPANDLNPVMTKVIGYIDGANSIAWEVNTDGTLVTPIKTGGAAIAALANATPLYFASGNLFIKDDEGFIEPTSTSTNANTYGVGTLNNGLFGCGDPTGEKTLSTDTYIYGHISGTSADIAHVQLSHLKGNWRLPTAVEWAFLIEEIAIDGKAGITAPRYWHSTNGYYDYTQANMSSTAAPWQNAGDQQGFLITSTVVNNSIFLPAVGARVGASPFGRGEYGYYWSGSEYRSPGTPDISAARDFLFYSNYWAVEAGTRPTGFAVRPVSE